MPNRTLFCLMAAVTCLGWIRWLDAAEPPPKPPSKPPSELADSTDERLVDLLGDPSFDLRKSAAQELTRRGVKARRALEAALGRSDLEVRLSAKQILRQVHVADMNARLEAFVNDVEGTGEHDLPGWKRYREMIGNDRAARKVFAEMLRVEAPLLEAYGDDVKSAAQLFAQRVQSFESGTIAGLQAKINSANLAALMFVGSDNDVTVSYTHGYQMYRHLSHTDAVSAITKGEQSAAMIKLLAAWLERDNRYSYFAQNNLMLALKYKLNDTALAIARKAAANSSASSSVVSSAILALGKFGKKEDVKLIEPLLKNVRLCHTYSNGKKTIRTQIRDVALVTLLHLKGQDPKDFGFDHLRANSQTLYSVYTCGFEQDKQREQAFAKWKSWSEMSD